MGRLYLLRHGQASLLEQDYDQLSPLGERQARVLGQWLASHVPRPVMLASGTLRRQSETLRLLVEAAQWQGVASRQEPALDEYDHDDMLARVFPDLAEPTALQQHLRASGHPQRAFQRLFERALTAWLHGDVSLAGGLSWAAFRERNVAVVREIAAGCGSGESAVVVTSGGPIAAICQALLDVPDTRVAQLHNAVFNASITCLLTRGEELALSAFNSVAHLELEVGHEALVSYR